MEITSLLHEVSEDYDESIVRSFLALPVHEKYFSDIKTMQRDLAADLRHTPNTVHWTEKQRLHLTLYFLGEQSPEKLAAFITEMQDNPLKLEAPIHFECSEATLFPDENPTVIALVGKCPPVLMQLRYDVNERLEKVGISPDVSHETHGFLPHITLGTLKKPTDFKNEFFDSIITLDKMVLFQSKWLEPYVVQHTPLQSWRLFG